ncbi:MAG: LysE family translocator [Spirochaetia bacterium]|nr:LysE family translocator [Spirochaetia bacterium]
MEIDLFSTFLFAFITTFTPGPNTISSHAMGMNYGYRRSLPYFAGIATGFFSIMVLSALFATLLQQLMPSVVPLLTILGSLYILYLAYHVFFASYLLSQRAVKALGYSNGLLLQLLNPKVIILGLTVYSTFLKEMDRSPIPIILSALVFTLMSFTALTTWALFGLGIARLLKTERTRRIVNAILSLLLVYTAVKMVLNQW